MSPCITASLAHCFAVFEMRLSPNNPCQALFGHLMLGRASSHLPKAFWASFRDYDGQPIDIKEHQDAYEFFTRLQVRGTPCRGKG